MRKYTVQLVFDVKSIDLLDVKVEANSPQEARKLAEISYDNTDCEFYSGEDIQAVLRENYPHEIIKEEE